MKDSKYKIIGLILFILLFGILLFTINIRDKIFQKSKDDSQLQRNIYESDEAFNDQSHQPSSIHNTLKKIQAAEDKIKLELVREWSFEETGDEQMAFFHPLDIEMDSKGNIYVQDTGNNRIQVFDSWGHYQTTIGRKGQGPGEFIRSNDIAIDRNGNIIALEVSNGQFQILNPRGEYLAGFQTNRITGKFVLFNDNGKFDDSSILTSNFIRSDNPKPLFLIYSYKGKVIHQIGEHKHAREKLSYLFYFTCDKDKNSYISYFGQPHIEKYDSTGNLTLTITYEINAKFSDERLAYAIDYDNGYLFLIIADRNKTEQEWRIGSKIATMGKGGKIYSRYMDHKIESEKTDIYRLLALNRFGRIVATKLLDIYADNLKVYNNKMFVIDSHVGMKIYEYKIKLDLN